MSAPVFTVDDYTNALKALMPPGRVWPCDVDSVQSLVLASLAPSFQRSGAAGPDLLETAFPATALDLLTEWEESLGLPDPCAGESPTLQGRRQQVVARLTGTGGQTIAFFIAYAQLLGYTVTVKQYEPFRCGQSRCGDQLGGPEWAHTWAVVAPLQTITYFRCGVSACGEPLESWGNTVLQCELQAIKPAQTIVLVEAVSAADTLAETSSLAGASVAATLNKKFTDTLTETVGGAAVAAKVSRVRTNTASDTLAPVTGSAAFTQGPPTGNPDGTTDQPGIVDV